VTLAGKAATMNNPGATDVLDIAMEDIAKGINRSVVTILRATEAWDGTTQTALYAAYQVAQAAIGALAQLYLYNGAKHLDTERFWQMSGLGFIHDENPQHVAYVPERDIR
jgi:hypothetical protein